MRVKFAVSAAFLKSLRFLLNNLNKSTIELHSDLLSILILDRLLNLPTLVQKQCLVGRPMTLLYTEYLITKP